MKSTQFVRPSAVRRPHPYRVLGHAGQVRRDRLSPFRTFRTHSLELRNPFRRVAWPHRVSHPRLHLYMGDFG